MVLKAELYYCRKKLIGANLLVRNIIKPSKKVKIGLGYFCVFVKVEMHIDI